MWGDRRAPVLAGMLAVGLFLAACQSGGGDAAVGGDGQDIGPDEAAFSHAGPYDVGVRTLQLDDDHKTEVFYPATAGATNGKSEVVYDMTYALGDSLAGMVPETLKMPYEVPAFRDVRAAAKGKFPVVVYSHGYGGWRTINATMLANIASWGFIVASTDKPDQRFEAVFLNVARPDWDPDVDAVLMSATLDRIIDEGKDGGILAGAVDAGHVAAMGHNSGGGDSYSMVRNDDRVDVGISWNYTFSEDVGNKPFMIIAADGDPVTPRVDADFAKLTGPSRLVQLANSGHMVPTDICDGLLSPDGLLSRLDKSNFRLPPVIDDVIRNGCEPGDLAVPKGQAVYLHFTIAELRDAFGIGKEGAGLGQEVVADLPALVVYTQTHIADDG